MCLDIRCRLEDLVSKLHATSFKDKLRHSALPSSDIERYSQMWDFCNKYMHPQPDGKFPNKREHSVFNWLLFNWAFPL